MCIRDRGVDYGIYHTTFNIQGDPLVSVIIPNKDHSVDLDLCIRSIIERATYKNLEFIVVENNSTEQETLSLIHICGGGYALSSGV